MLTISLDGDKDLIEGVNRMATMNCSNELVNNTILELAGGVSFLKSWQPLLLAMVSLNLFIIYFGNSFTDPMFYYK